MFCCYCDGMSVSEQTATLHVSKQDSSERVKVTVKIFSKRVKPLFRISHTYGSFSETSVEYFLRRYVPLCYSDNKEPIFLCLTEEYWFFMILLVLLGL